MMQITKVFSIGLVALLITGCVTQGNQKELGGGLIGASLGGLAGSRIGTGNEQLAAVAIGTLIGAIVGKEVGSSLDKIDQLYAERAQQQAAFAPIGHAISWSNPQSGNSGMVMPVRQGTNLYIGAHCREHQTTVNANGYQQTSYRTICLQSDGNWQTMN